MWGKYRVAWLLAVVTGLIWSADPQTGKSPMVEPKSNSQIVFVCEHGAASSVVAAAYFNKIAQEKHLNMHAIARGIEPQKDLSASAHYGLDSDGVAFETKRPQRLSTEEAKNARRVVAFYPLPAKYRTTTLVESWTDVPPTAANYTRARDAILIHLDELIRQLQSEGTKSLRHPTDQGLSSYSKGDKHP